MARKRRARRLATLVYVNEPQLLALESYSTKLLAVAVPRDRKKIGKAPFLAVTVRNKDWDKYFHNQVDLRYLFVYPNQFLYVFDLMELRDDTVMMEPFEGGIPDKWLPSRRFFASDHTEDFEVEEEPEDTETLFIDGEWGM